MWTDLALYSNDLQLPDLRSGPSSDQQIKTSTFEPNATTQNEETAAKAAA
jgi:hypothetical protein